MIDGVKIAVPLSAQQWLRRSEKIDWVQNGVFSNGLQRYKGTWSGWHFKGDPDRCVEVRGSFHKYAHGGSNWRDIGLEEVTDAVHRFCERLLLHPAQLVLRNVEVGVNFPPPKPPKELFPCLVHHRLKGPKATDHGLQFIHDGYRVKVYDKAAQEGLDEEVLRFEVKLINMREARELGFRLVSDLLVPENWLGIPDLLIKKFDDILIAERATKGDVLLAKDLELLRDARELGFWQGLSSSKRSRYRTRLYDLYVRVPGFKLRYQLRNAIRAKASLLTPRLQFIAQSQIATFTPRVMGHWLGRYPPSNATFTPLIARSADVATRPWAYERSRGPPSWMMPDVRDYLAGRGAIEQDIIPERCG